MNVKPELGILFVHGIGEQRPGQTLTDFGEPFCDWLRNWLSRDEPKSVDESESQVVIGQTILSRPDSQTPPHFFVELKNKNSDKTKQNSTWLFAESYWAESFPLPDLQDVTLWLMRVTPWACLSYASRRIKIQTREFSTAFTDRIWFKATWTVLKVLTLFFISLILLMPLAWLLELFLFILFLIGALPVPVIRNYVSWIQAKLSAILGDSYIFASSSLRRQAAISQLQADIKWILPKCQKLVIVAHSQGAALAYLALKQHIPGKLKLLVTFGSGIVKLVQLLESHTPTRNPQQSSGWRILRRIRRIGPIFGIAILTVSAFLLLIVYVGNAVGLIPKGYIFVLFKYHLQVELTLFIMFAVFLSMYESSDEIKKFGTRLKNSGTKWLDIFSSADPVSNGPTYLDDQSLVDSVMIWNKRSIITDHTAYTSNHDSFWPAIVKAMATHQVTSLPLGDKISGKDDFLLTYSGELRRIWTSWFSLLWCLLLAALILTLLNDHASLDLGRSIEAWINSGCSNVDLLLVKDIKDAGECWTIQLRVTGAISFIVLYLIIARVVSLCQKVLMNSFFADLSQHDADAYEYAISRKYGLLIFTIGYFPFFALSFSVHLYISESFELIERIADDLFLDPLYLQESIFAAIAQLIVTMVYFVWDQSVARRLHNNIG